MDSILSESAFKELSVLIVEDNKSFTHLLQEYLEIFGVGTVVTVEDGSAALGKLDGARFNVILCDLGMKPMGGIEFLQVLRTSSSFRFDRAKCSTPCIFLTGSLNQNDVSAAKKLGVHGYLLKPFSREKLLDRLSAATGVS